MAKNKNKVGRPRMYKSPEEIQAKIDEYFEYCDNRQVIKQVEDKDGTIKDQAINIPEPYTIAGLAYYLGFTDRRSVTEYGNLYPEFSDTIKRAKLRIERQRSERLVQGFGSVPGMIFDLKNNFGWKDEHKHEVKTISTITKQDIENMSKDERAELKRELEERLG
jgi:hypothetical protein